MSCGSRLFASYCQKEIKENLPLPSGPNGMVEVKGGQWRGRAISRAPNCCNQQSPVSSNQSKHLRSELQTVVEGQTQYPHSPELVPCWGTRYPNHRPRSHITSHQESQPTDGHCLRFTISKMGFLGLPDSAKSNEH